MVHETHQTSPAWFSVADAATYSGVSPKTVRRWIAAGRLKATKPTPRVLRVSRVALDELLEKHATTRNWEVA